jgi:hypothetical protein
MVRKIPFKRVVRNTIFNLRKQIFEIKKQLVLLENIESPCTVTILALEQTKLAFEEVLYQLEVISQIHYEKGRL